VTLSILGVVHADFAGAYTDAAFRMTGSEHALFQTTTSDDLALGKACLEIEAGIRRRQWAALESLLGAIPPGGDLSSIYEPLPEQSLTALQRLRLAAG
jgi:hypothetical protein